MKIKIRTMTHGPVIRYVITTDDGRFWNASSLCWVSAMSQATLFDSHDKVSRAWRALRDNYCSGKNGKKYEATVKVIVRTDRFVELEEVLHFLAENCNIIVDLEDEPDDLMTDVEIDWDSLKEVR